MLRAANCERALQSAVGSYSARVRTKRREPIFFWFARVVAADESTHNSSHVSRERRRRQQNERRYRAAIVCWLNLPSRWRPRQATTSATQRLAQISARPFLAARRVQMTSVSSSSRSSRIRSSSSFKCRNRRAASLLNVKAECRRRANSRQSAERGKVLMASASANSNKKCRRLNCTHARGLIAQETSSSTAAIIVVVQHKRRSILTRACARAHAGARARHTEGNANERVTNNNKKKY